MGLCAECLIKAGFPSGSGTESGAPATFTPPTVEEIARLFPQLEVFELIGKGGMGAVYRARQKQLNRFVALKILPPGISDAPAFAARFTREAQALALLNHPGIVTLFEFGKVDGLYFFLMEYVDGVNLRQLLNAGRVSAREALAIVPQICDALQYAHDQGIVHRDIKPENILLDRRGRVKVADFGLAKLVGVGNEPAAGGVTAAGSPALTESGKVMGTPQYMSPEQLQAPGEVDHRADIYALGVVFYQMLTGELPGKTIEPPSKKVSIDVRLDEVVLRALEENPERRYQQASVLKTQVETIATTPEQKKSDDRMPKSGAPEAEWEGRAPGWRIRCRKCGFTEHWGKYGIRMGATGTTRTIGRCARCGRWRIHVIEKGPVPPNQTVEPASSGASALPHFSRTAIVGAAWAPLFFIAFLGMFTAHAVPGGEYHGPAWWQYALLFTLLPMGITAPFGTTILGWVAVYQIRHSAGRLYGMWLAVFDGLLFPLLALDTGVMWCWARLGEAYWRSWFEREPSLAWADYVTAMVALGIAGILILDFFIVRRVWRAVNRPDPGEVTDGGPPSAPPGRPALGVLALALAFAGLAVPLLVLQLVPPSSAAMFFSVMILVFLLCELAALVLSVFAWRSPVGKVAFAAAVLCSVLWGLYVGRQADQQYKALLGPNASDETSFGPTQERVITVGNDARSFFSFDREDYAPGPTEFDPTDHDRTYGDLWKWLTSNHVDVFATQRNGKPVLTRCEMVTTDLNEDEFDTLTLAKLTSNRVWQEALKAQFRSQESSTLNRGKLRGDKDTFVFENRFGVTGLIQVIGVTSDPPAVKIRYRLAQTDPTQRNFSAGFKPIPPEAVRVAWEMNTLDRSPLGSTNTEAKAKFAREMNSRSEALMEMLRGTIAESLVREQEKAMKEIRGAAGQNNGFVSKEQVRELDGRGDRLALMVLRAGPAGFTPVVETTVTAAKPGGFDLDRGRFQEIAPDELNKGPQWSILDGIDLVVLRAEDTKWLNSSNTIVTPADDANVPGLGDLVFVDASRREVGRGYWGKSADQVLADPLIDAVTMETRGYNSSSHARPHWNVSRKPHNRSDLPTYLFKTREGRVGVLQITEVAENPRGVRIHYKLLQGASTSALTPSAATSLAESGLKDGAPSFGPVIELVFPFGVPCLGQYLQFHTGKIIQIGSGPSDAYDHTAEIASKGGVDASVSQLAHSVQLAGRGCILLKAKPQDWETMTTEMVLHTLETEKWIQGVLEIAEKDFPATCLFKAARGDCGLLQITGFTEAPRGVKVRFKLVQTAAAAPPPTSVRLVEQETAPLRFGDVYEMTLTEANRFYGREALDLDRQTVLAQPPPEELEAGTRLFDWVATNGIDLLADPNPEHKFDLLAINPHPPMLSAVSNDRWDRISREEFTNKAGDGHRELGKIDREAFQAVPLPPAQDLPWTWTFRTREGSRGLLQVTGFSRSPPGVNIRYKIAQNGERRDEPAGSNAASAPAAISSSAKSNPAKVLLVASRPNRFLEKALRAVPDVEFTVSTNLTDPATEFDLVVLDNAVPAVWPTGNILAIHVQQPNWFEQPGSAQAPPIVGWRDADPLLGHAGFDDVHVRECLVAKAPSWAVSLADSTQGSLALAGELGRQRIIWVGFDILESDWPLRVSFPIFIANAVEWLSPADSPARSSTPARK